MSLADEMRERGKEAKAQQEKNAAEIREQARIYRLRVEAEELEKRTVWWDDTLAQIRRAAKKGTSFIHLYYYDNNQRQKFRLQLIAETARANGFNTQFGSKTTDHGDFAAPCVTTDYWLKISW